MNMKVKPPAPDDEVWYFASPEHPRGPRGTLAVSMGEALPAIVTAVHTIRVVDLEVTDSNGDAQRLSGVCLLQPGDPHPRPLMGHAQWTKDPWKDPSAADSAQA